MVRILLLMLLAAVAVILYLEGQKYDPALIDFKSSAVSSGSVDLPVEIAGYSRTGDVRLFTRENLCEYINGHAEYFISAGFEVLSVGEYVNRGADQENPEIVIEVYDIGNGIQAFGVLADEAGDNPLNSEVGTMSFRSSQGLSFIAGKYYVKVNAYRKDAPLLEIAELIESGIGGESGLIDSFSGFPDLGTPVRTRYIREAYRGLDFVGNVIEREYDLNGREVQVFLVTGEGEEIRELTALFLDFFDESGIEYREMEETGSLFYQVLDPYEGDWFLIPRDDALFGIFGNPDPGIVQQFIQESAG